MTLEQTFGLWVANGACLAIGFVLGAFAGVYGVLRWVSVTHHVVHPASGLVLPDDSNGLVKPPSLVDVSQHGTAK